MQAGALRRRRSDDEARSGASNTPRVARCRTAVATAPGCGDTSLQGPPDSVQSLLSSCIYSNHGSPELFKPIDSSGPAKGGHSSLSAFPSASRADHVAAVVSAFSGLRSRPNPQRAADRDELADVV